MYLQYFGLSEAPFSITPDPAFVYLSAAHRDALAHLLYGVGQGGSGGFVQLTGEVGTGKTTLCRCLLEQVPDDTQVALVLNSLVTPQELLATICEELGIDIGDISNSNKQMVDALNAYLLKQHARGRRVVVVIDEAQNLSPEALEQVRLLTNLETAKDKLLQMVLLGQPELRQLLQRSDLRQLSQRITARYHLTPLNREETQAYVKHRMQVAGARQNPFRRSAMKTLYVRSGGVPRLINIIADRALASAYAKESGGVSAALVNAAADEVQPSEAQMSPNRWPLTVVAASTAALVAIGILGWQGLPLDRWFNEPEPASPAVANAITAPAQLQPEAIEKSVTAPSSSDQTGLPVGAPGGSEPAVLQRLEGDWLNEQHRQAWRTMADLWQDGQNAYAIASACDGLAGRGYQCLRDQGNWSRIQKLGLPVLLVLQAESPRHVVLRGFSDQGLLVGPDDDMTTVAREAIEELWLGEYMVAWPQAPDWPIQISRGESGAAVDIVMEMAGFAEPAWTGGSLFDAGFESWLMDFQRRNGLRADGIVGPNTLIYLMAPTITEPRLILESGERS